jgi:TRAP-type mannitol/chloroaromatic compound transport system permease large subunit
LNAFAGVAVIFGVLTQGVDLFGFMPYRIMSVMQNTILMAVPLFIFMGIVISRLIGKIKTTLPMILISAWVFGEKLR